MVGELSNLANWDKADIRNSSRIGERSPQKKRAEEGSPAEKTEEKGKRRTRKKAVQKAGEES
jgi:hypothetical protein